MIQSQARRSRERFAPSGALYVTMHHQPSCIALFHSANVTVSMQHTYQTNKCKKNHMTSIPPISRHLLLPMGSNDDWVKLGFQMASNSPNHTAQHTCKAELAAWHVVYFVPILVGNGQAHATIQCGHCPPPEAENCNPQNTAEHALGEVM